MSAELDIDGRLFLIEPMGSRAAMEAECILFGAIGPGIGVGLGTMIEPTLDRIAEHVRTHLRTPTPAELEAEEDPPPFDLARGLSILDTLDTSSSVVQGWTEALLDSLGPLAARALDSAAPAFIEALGWDRVRRLVELALLGSAFVFVNGEPRKISDWKALDAATNRSWSAKWRLLVAAGVEHFNRVAEVEE